MNKQININRVDGKVVFEFVAVTQNDSVFWTNHILAHEDRGMMQLVSVVNPDIEPGNRHRVRRRFRNITE
jgi:hypothetical protein